MQVVVFEKQVRQIVTNTDCFHEAARVIARIAQMLLRVLDKFNLKSAVRPGGVRRGGGYSNINKLYNHILHCENDQLRSLHNSYCS